jgi:hypothetical protein
MVTKGAIHHSWNVDCPIFYNRLISHKRRKTAQRLNLSMGDNGKEG